MGGSIGSAFYLLVNVHICSLRPGTPQNIEFQSLFISLPYSNGHAGAQLPDRYYNYYIAKLLVTNSLNKIGFFRNKNLSLHLILIPIFITMDKKQGTVKFFNTEKGFGFIKHDDSNQETFVHASGLIDQIKEGDKVEFDVQNGKKGLNAVNVKLV